jgi:APA family basic amino acid/polyamine antiporter
MAPAIDRATAKQEASLARRFGLATATALVAGEVIGVFVFLTPAAMAKSIGSPFWLFAVWLAMGISAIGGALCYGALAARFPEVGGGYVYLREAYGPRMAFLYGWLSLFVTDPGLVAALAVGMQKYAAYLAPLSSNELKAVSVAAILCLAAANILGAWLGSGMLRTLAALKIGLLFLLIAWGFLFGRGDWGNFTPFLAQRPGSDPLPGALAGGLIGSFFSFAGWWDASKIAGEVRDPERTLPHALILGISIVTVLYVAITAVFLYLVQPARIASDEAFAALVGEALFGRAGGVIFSSIVIVSILGSLAALLMAAPRVYYAMACDGLFFATFARIDSRRGTPAKAVALQAALACVLALTGSFREILDYFVVATLLFVSLTVAAVFVLGPRRAFPSSLRMPGYPLSPLLFLLPISVLMGLLFLGNPLRSSLGLLVVLLGVPVSGWVVARRAKSLQTEILA